MKFKPALMKDKSEKRMKNSNSQPIFIRKNVVDEKNDLSADLEVENIMSTINLNETMVSRKNKIKKKEAAPLPELEELKSDPKKALGLKKYQLWKSKKNLHDDQIICQVCFTNYPDSIFMNCGHGGICYDCALNIWQSSNNCYLCRDQVKYIL